MSSVVKLGPWGGDCGSAFDLTVAPRRLESITVRWGKVIDFIAFSYRDRSGKLHTAGPWGGNGKGEDTETIMLEPSEYVTGVAWSVGPFVFKNVERCITSIKFVTNLGRSYGPFGHGVDSTDHALPVLSGGVVVGMFARAGDFLDAIGFYILPPDAAAAAAAAALPPAINPTTDNNGQEEKEKDNSNHEDKEKDKSNNQDEKEKDSSKEEKVENGKKLDNVKTTGLSSPSPSPVVKIGAWGGEQGTAYDIDTAAPPPQRLESISLRWGKIIDRISFSYRDAEGQLHAAGPWGGAGGVSEETIALRADEYVTEVAGSVGPIGDLARTVTSLKLVTNRGTYGPFGRGDGTPFSVPVLNNGTVVAMFARASQYLDAIGFYVLPF